MNLESSTLTSYLNKKEFRFENNLMTNISIWLINLTLGLFTTVWDY